MVSELILGALAPSAIEVSLQLAEDLELERAERGRRWKQRLEQARYETELARRRYEAVDPQNRLVARTLERDWEASLTAEHTLQAEHDRDRARQRGSYSRQNRRPFGASPKIFRHSGKLRRQPPLIGRRSPD